LGLPKFKLLVDHQPLVSILDRQTLDMVDNPKLQRLKERLSPFVFDTTWRKGKDHSIPDALSRAPVGRPSEEDDAVNAEITSHARHCVVRRIQSMDDEEGSEITPRLRDPLLDNLRSIAAADPAYEELIQAISNGFPLERHHTSGNVRQFWAIRMDLSIDDGLVLYNGRIVVPQAARRDILKKLHSSHQGITRTKRRARQALYWPGMSNDIVLLVEGCQPCQQTRPSLPKEPMILEPPPHRIFEDVSADLFQHGNLHVLVYIDRLSGWPAVHRWHRDPTAKDVIAAIAENFVDLGVPNRFRSDGGPQFAAGAFQQFLHRWGVAPAPSSPHYPQGNGHAEAAVKVMENLILKLAPTGDFSCEAFSQGLLELRNTPGETGSSPAEIVFGHNLRSILPAHHSSYAPRWKAASLERDRIAAAAAKAKVYYDAHAHPLKPIKIGTEVRIQDEKTKSWEKIGVVVAIGKFRSYRVKFASGSVLWRNRRFLRPIREAVAPPTTNPEEDATAPARDDDDGGTATQTPTLHPSPRRSHRQRRAPNRLNI
jgi:hypothetical protein